MEKYITRDKLADFIEKMWDSGIKCDLKPQDKTISLWSSDLSKMEYITVVDKRTYDSLVADIRSKFLPIDNGSHEPNSLG